MRPVPIRVPPQVPPQLPPQVLLRMSVSPAADDPITPLRTLAADRAYVIAQLGQSLDGRIATVSGESRYINGTAALDHLHRIRAHVDAVIVGVGTVIADDPLLTVRRVAGRNPVRVVIDPNGRLPATARLLHCREAETLIIRPADSAAPGVLPVFPREGRLHPADILAALAARGLRKVLVEGGARTISDFLAADALDRLHVLVAPLLIGSGKPGLDYGPNPRLADAVRPKTQVHVLSDGDVLFDCDLRARAM
jgi:diaminohydroxyphosphoribosylaminopyrimidine deaminase / 5-amino-6-(5-phosphoribosylamino)uracil reductase